MNLYEIEDESGEQHAFIADSEQEAKNQYFGIYGKEAEPIEGVELLSDTRQISIYDFDGAGETVEKTAKEWVELIGKKEMLYSSVF